MAKQQPIETQTHLRTFDEWRDETQDPDLMGGGFEASLREAYEAGVNSRTINLYCLKHIATPASALVLTYPGGARAMCLNCLYHRFYATFKHWTSIS